MKDFLSVLAALAGLVSAWIGYRAVVKNERNESRTNFRVIGVSDPSISTTRWKPLRFFWFSLISITIFSVIWGYIYGFNIIFSPIVLTTNVILLVFTFIVLRFSRQEPPSHVYKSIELTVMGEPHAVFDLAREAVHSVGGKIAKLNFDEGIIEAKRPTTMWTLGIVIEICLKTKCKNINRLTISCDSIIPSARFDFGRNSRLLRKIRRKLVDF